MLPFSFLIPALLIVSLLTNLTVEGIKKLLDKSDKNYSSNLLAVIVAIIIAIALSAGYLLLNDVTFNAKILVEIVVLIYLSFLASTVGYDKVIQMIEQIKMGKVE